MRSFMLSLATLVVLTAESTAKPAEVKAHLQKVILEEIMESVWKIENNDLMQEIYVEEALTPNHCTMEDLCKAGKVLDKIQAKDLKLPEQGWLLPRRLVAYTRNIQCTAHTTHEKVDLQTLVGRIKKCVQFQRTNRV